MAQGLVLVLGLSLALLILALAFMVIVEAFTECERRGWRLPWRRK